MQSTGGTPGHGGTPPGPKPNIVFLLLDNVGWGNFGCYGGMIPTPRIDQMASEGIRFANYNVECQCTPTRSAIHTGRHPPRSGTFKVPPPGIESGLCPWEYTIAELLSDAGYATALFGKWHLGEHNGRLPNDQGYDKWWGIPNTSDEAGYTEWPMFKESGMPVPMILEGEKGGPSRAVMPFDMKVRPLMDGEYINPKTIAFIKEKASARQPFFVYAAYTELHPPIAPHPKFAGQSRSGGVFADLIAEMDYRLGEVLDAIKEAGVEDNTIVILSSDNAGGGASPHLGPGSQGPWRGNFMNSPFEGCMRVPCIVRCPGKVPAGVATNEILAALDWLPTFAGLAGVPHLVPTDRPIDGIDASAFLLGQSETTGREHYLFFGPDGLLMSVKWKMFKMVLRYTEDTIRPAIESPLLTPQFPMIYDLTSDPHEDNNLLYSDFTGWMIGPMMRYIVDYERSVGQYRNIVLGEDFKGYS